jgi:hypothetical protein
MQRLQFQRTHTSADHSITTKCCLRQWDARHKSTRRPTNKEHGHYHSIDGWYLFTSPEHYRTHTCHVKATKSERHSETVHFKHKNITNPTITHADKVMQALAECIKTITGATGGTTAQEVKDLQCIVKATQAIYCTRAKHPVPTATPSNELRGCPTFRGCTHFRGCPRPQRTING